MKTKKYGSFTINNTQHFNKVKDKFIRSIGNLTNELSFWDVSNWNLITQKIDKSMKIILFVLLLFSAFQITAQEADRIKSEKVKDQKIFSPNSVKAKYDQIIFKNENDSTVLSINDEGNNGASITLPMVGTSLTGNKLYNNGGSLYWGNVLLSSSVGASNINDLSDAKTGGNSIFLGSGSGANDDGTDNKNYALGLYSLGSNTSGYANIGMGFNSLFFNTTGIQNLGLGQGALYYNSTGNKNVAIGYHANHHNQTGNNNTIIGHEAGRGTSTHNKSGNVFVGYQAGYNETGSNKLYIENSSNNPLIYGDFSNDSVHINNKLTVLLKTKTKDFQVTRNAVNGYVLTSDENGNATWQPPLSSVSELNNLSDVNYDGSSLFIGENSGNSDDGTTNLNTAVGKNSLSVNISGNNNTALGYNSLLLNESGSRNTTIGLSSLLYNYSGNDNTANGYKALFSNAYGNKNIAIGSNALYSSVADSDNIAIGYDALRNNNGGVSNIAIGQYALEGTILNNSNVALGVKAISYFEGNDNIAIGYGALWSTMQTRSGNNNIAIGRYSGPGSFEETVNESIYIGKNASGGQTTWSQADNQIAIGTDANCYGVNVVAIGYNASASFDNKIRLGNSSITSIGGYAAWSNLSDGRYKSNIKENVSGLEFILGLRPVTFNLDINTLAAKLGEDYKVDKNGNKIKKSPSIHTIKSRDEKTNKRQVGFIAQEVEALVNQLGIEFSGVEIPENENSMYRLRYSEFVVPLVKAVQEQQIIIDELIKRIEDLEN